MAKISIAEPQKIKLAGYDLDGTLYDPHLRVSPYNLQAVRAWAAAGRLTAICSGRMIPRISALMRDELAVSGYKMCLNGALVYDEQDRLLAARPLNPRTVMDVFAIAKRYAVQVRFYTELTHAFYKPGQRSNYYGSELERDVNFTTAAQLRQMLRHASVHFYKFTLEAPYGNLAGLYLALRALRRLPLNMTRSKMLLYEGLAPGVDKLFGMRVIARAAGISLSDCMCFGDQLNDLTMVRGVGYGVAMKNAVAPVRRVARYVAPSNLRDGVGKTLNAILAGEKL